MNNLIYYTFLLFYMNIKILVLNMSDNRIVVILIVENQNCLIYKKILSKKNVGDSSQHNTIVKSASLNKCLELKKLRLRLGSKLGK